MTEPRSFSLDAQRYLDGEPAGQIEPGERASADRLNSALAAYVGALVAPDERVDEAVMRRLSVEPHRRGAAGWRWMFAPHVVRIRPALLALAASLALVVWWVSAGPQHAATGPVTPAVASDTVLVRFELSAPDAHEVSLAGSFNAWQAPGIPLRRSPVPGLWTVTLPLPVGEHEYLFIVDGRRWIADPTAHAQVDDGFGRSNSVIIVGPRGVARS